MRPRAWSPLDGPPASVLLSTRHAEGPRLESIVGNRIKVRHWAAHAFAESFADTLGPAPNYVEIAFDRVDGSDEGLVVTVQRASGKSPNTLRREAEERCELLRVRAEAAEQELADLHDQLDMFGEGIASP